MFSTLLYRQHCYKRLVTRGRIELPFAAWEAAVLAAWPTGHNSSDFRYLGFAVDFVTNPQRTESGTPSRARTVDPLIKSQLLYQLS